MRKLIHIVANINKMWWLVLLSIGLAIAATMVIKSYLKDREQALQTAAEQSVKGGPTVEVIAAKVNIGRGGILDGGSLAKREIAADLLNDDMLTPEDFAQVDGSKAARSIKAGSPLRIDDVMEKPKGFAETLEPGTRAITIEVDEINSMAQMVKPGNMVDLMLIVPDADDPDGGFRAVLVLQQVKVLATGQTLESRASKADDNQGGPGGKKNTYSNFTFEVTPQNAARIALAQQVGKIRAVLRGNDDISTASLNDIDSKSMLKMGKSARAAEKIAVPKKVEYIIGGSGVANTDRQSLANLPSTGLPLNPLDAMRSALPPDISRLMSPTTNRANAQPR
jgi:pilus assembly protein CpaB